MQKLQLENLVQIMHFPFTVRPAQWHATMAQWHLHFDTPRSDHMIRLIITTRRPRLTVCTADQNILEISLLLL